MAHPQVCIVARPMSRLTDHVTRIAGLLLVVGVITSALTGLGCKQLDGRSRNRKGNKLFRETQFVDAAAEYEEALKEVDDPIIHFNLGLAYSKVFKPGYDKPVLLGESDESLCKSIPGTKPADARVCVKEGDRHYIDCDDKNVCPSSFQCKKTTFCSLDSIALADLSAAHFKTWIKVQPSDDDIKAQLKVLLPQLEDAKTRDDKTAIVSLEKKVDELQSKDKIRKQMTQLWIESNDFTKALAYWTQLLADKPNDPDIMGNLAGINLKADDWRKSIEWYLKVASVSTETSSKVAAYQFIGNVAWSKLNSKKLSAIESIELADRGIGALQKAAEISPKNPRLFGLQGSIYNFRAQIQGASWAAALDRASAQDLQHTSHVISEEAKKAQGLAPTTPVAPATPSTPVEKTGG